MATYLILNLLFIIAVCLLLRLRPHRPSKSLAVTFITLVVLTAVFDNVIIGLDIVDYDPEKILGIKLLYAPIEDFMYAILAVVLVPTLWHKLGNRHAR